MRSMTKRIEKLENFYSASKGSTDLFAEMDSDQLMDFISACSAEWSSLKKLMKKCKQIVNPLGELTDEEEPSGLNIREKARWWAKRSAEVRITLILQSSYADMGYDKSRAFIALAEKDPALAPAVVQAKKLNARDAEEISA